MFHNSDVFPSNSDLRFHFHVSHNLIREWMGWGLVRCVEGQTEGELQDSDGGSRSGAQGGLVYAL